MAPAGLPSMLLGVFMSIVIGYTNCNAQQMDCPSINGTGVRNYTMQFPETPVPAANWTIICRRFDLPNDSVADIIAIEPVIANAEVLRYMVLYGCTAEPPANDSYLCEIGGDRVCSSIIGLWSFGSAGQCLNSQLGFRFGATGYRYAIVQLYWNNPQLKTNLVDSSGMRIYYTTELRPYAGQIVSIGQTSLEIPPGKDEVTATGSCRQVCTGRLPHSMFITSAVLHMNLLGKRGNISLIRNGTILHTLDIPLYVNMLNIIEFEHPIELTPGDEVRVTCVYESTQRNSTTYFGKTLLDEMCIGLFVYYPSIRGIKYCGQWKSISQCSYNGDWQFPLCDFHEFVSYILSLNESCAENCSANDCTTLLDNLNATQCLDYADARSFAQVFFYNYYPILLRCSSARLSSEATTSLETTHSLNTNSTLHSTMPTISSSNHSPNQKALFAHVIWIICGIGYLSSVDLLAH